MAFDYVKSFRQKILLAVWVAAAGGPAAGLDLPRWDVSDAPARLAVPASPGTLSHLVVRVAPEPAELADGVFSAFNAAGQPLGVRSYPVAGEEGAVDVVVAARRGDHRDEIYLYLGGTPGRMALEASRDPAPIMVWNRRRIGRALPRDWAGMEFLLARTRVEASAGAPVADFNDRIPDVRGGGVREHVTYLAIAEAGSYRFGLAGCERAFLRVNGQPVGAYAWDGDPRSWSETPALELEPGLHELHVVTVRSPAASRLHLGWFQPGKSLETLSPDLLVAGTRIEHPRFERKDRLVHPDFQIGVRAAYQFRDSETLFGQWSLRSTSVGWAGGRLQTRWTVEGRHELSGPAATAFLPVPETAEVRLRVTDRLGLTEELARTVRLEPGLVQQFAVDAWWLDLPAHAYPHDRAQPAVLVQGEMSRALAFDLDFAYLRDGRPVEEGSHAFNLGREQRVVHLPELRLGDADRVEWTLRHLGRPIRQGAARIERARSWTRPLKPRGSGWVDEDGDKLVFLAEAWPGGDARPAGPRPMFWLDEALAAGAFDPEQARRRLAAAEVEVAFPAPAPPDGALARLHLLAAALRQTEAAEADRLVLSLGLAWMLDHTPTAQIERDAAVLADLLHARGRRDLIWVAPPRFPGWEEEAREVMQAVKRVARARDLPVADLYMPSATDPASLGWFERGNPALNALGLERSARAVRRLAEAGHGG